MEKKKKKKKGRGRLLRALDRVEAARRGAEKARRGEVDNYREDDRAVLHYSEDKRRGREMAETAKRAEADLQKEKDLLRMAKNSSPAWARASRAHAAGWRRDATRKYFKHSQQKLDREQARRKYTKSILGKDW